MLHSILYSNMHFENFANSPLFKVFLPVIPAECTKVTRVYGHFQDKLYLFIYLTSCLVANFKQSLWSNQYFV
jgi:hypothetical protein